MARRWIRIDVGWSDSEWVGGLEPAGRLAWIELLTYAKRDGVAGVVKALTPTAFGRKARIPTEDVAAMLEAAKQDGALEEAEGNWSVTNWGEYQETDPTAKERMRRHRSEKSAHSPLRRNNRNTPSQPVTGGVTRRVTVTETESKAVGSARESDEGPAATESVIDDLVRAANAGMRENPEIADTCRPIPIAHGSRQFAHDWIADGIPAELCRRVVHEKARAWKRQGRDKQISTMAYFDAAVREEFDRACHASTNGNGNGDYHDGSPVIQLKPGEVFR